VKAFEVKINKTVTEVADGFETAFGWPSWWNEVVESVNVEAYEESDRRDNHVTGCVCVCEDDVWNYIKGKKDKAVKELTEDQANEKGKRWRPQAIKIQDPVGVLAACAKAALGKALTVAEKQALDPTSKVPGVTQTEEFNVGEVFKRHGKTIAAKDKKEKNSKGK